MHRVAGRGRKSCLCGRHAGARLTRRPCRWARAGNGSGWLEPLNKAIYPPRSAWRTASSARMPAPFDKRRSSNVRSNRSAPEETSGGSQACMFRELASMRDSLVGPGCAQPRVRLRLWNGVSNDLLGEGGVDNLAPYEAFRLEREALIEKGGASGLSRGGHRL